METINKTQKTPLTHPIMIKTVNMWGIVTGWILTVKNQAGLLGSVASAKAPSRQPT